MYDAFTAPPGFIPLADNLFMLPSDSDPLSAEVFVFCSSHALWCFDTGCGQRALQALMSLPAPRYAVISHFHPDHMGNALTAGFDRVYLGAYAYKKTGPAAHCICVEDKITLPGNPALSILPLPSSHAKGSLILEAGRYLFTGDGLYAGVRQTARCYNATLLHDTLRALEGTAAPYIVESHQGGIAQPRAQVISRLRSIYARRQPEESYIPL